MTGTNGGSFYACGGTGLNGNELYPRFSDAEYDRRYQAARGAMRQDDLNAILISSDRGSSEIHYLSNYLAHAQPVEPGTLVENMVHIIQPNPITRDFKAGLQLGAAVIVKPNGGEPLHNYPFKFPVCG